MLSIFAEIFLFLWIVDMIGLFLNFVSKICTTRLNFDPISWKYANTLASNSKFSAFDAELDCLS